MKLILTAVAALVVLAMPVHAAEKAAAANLAATEMSAEKCEEAIKACNGDKDCLSKLEAQGCKKAQ